MASSSPVSTRVWRKSACGRSARFGAPFKQRRIDLCSTGSPRKRGLRAANSEAPILVDRAQAAVSTNGRSRVLSDPAQYVGAGWPTITFQRGTAAGTRVGLIWVDGTTPG